MQYTWSKQGVPLVTVNVYTTKDKFMVQPGQRKQDNLLDWVKAVGKLLPQYKKLCRNTQENSDVSPDVEISKQTEKHTVESEKEIENNSDNVSESMSVNDEQDSQQVSETEHSLKNDLTSKLTVKLPLQCQSLTSFSALCKITWELLEETIW
jgi:hypothetical protein